MRMKKEYIVLAVVIVGLVAYLVSRNQDRNLYDLPQVEATQAKEITRLELAMAKGDIMFTKEGSDWKISPDNYAADPQKVKEMLTVVEDLTLTELISESKNYQRYDLDAKDSISLKCWVKDDLKFELLIGKSAGSFNHTFVKLPEDEAVYHAKGNFRNKFDMEKGEFREKTVLVFDKETIGVFDIKAKEGTETFKNIKAATPSAETALAEGAETTADQNGDRAPQWMDSKGEAADADKIKNLISSLSNLKCEKFMESKSKEDLSDPVYTITLTGAKDYTLSLYAEMEVDGESFFPAVSSENAYPFLLAQWQSENIMKTPKDLQKKTDQTEQ